VTGCAGPVRFALRDPLPTRIELERLRVRLRGPQPRSTQSDLESVSPDFGLIPAPFVQCLSKPSCVEGCPHPFRSLLYSVQ
jgi:hypothetical protein